MSAGNHSRQKIKEPQSTGVEGEWQRLWYQLQSTSWSSLALVPTDATINVTRVAEALVAVGRRQGNSSMTLLSGVGVRPNDVQSLLSSVREASLRHGRLVVACDGLQVNPAALPLARACTGLLLVVRLGESRLDSARKTVESIGRNRIIASITLGPKS